MSYENYSAKDFAADEYFISWVKNPNKQNEPFWQQWMIEHPKKKHVIEEAKLIVRTIEFRVDPDAQERTQAIWKRITATNEVQKYMPAKIKVRPWAYDNVWYRSLPKVAASVIGILLFNTVLYFIYKNQPIEYRTAFGEKQEIILPDSSTVILNANSKLKLNKNWGTNREVWLEGEAFFSVQKKKVANQKKANNYSTFIVHINTIKVNVLGTEFNVSDRKQNTVVVLNSGQIQLSLPNKEENIFMKPGDLVELLGNEQKLTKKVVDPQIYTSWINDEWILDDFTLREVALKIEETYGVQVVIKNKDVSEKVLSGIIPTNNLNVLIEVLSTTLKLKITKNNNYIIFE